LAVNSLKTFSALIIIVVFCFAAGCSENTENSTGLVLLPSSIVGDLPTQKRFDQAFDIRTVPGEPANKGEQTRIYVGNMSQYEMRTLLAFRVVLPDNAEIITAQLNLYVVSIKGELPVRLSVHLLEREFVENEVTYQIAAEGEPWSTPGGDYQSSALGEAVFEGNEIDTVVVDLDIKVLNSKLSAADTTLPMIVLTDREESVLGLLSWESYPDQPIASRLDLVFDLPPETETYLLERRSFSDATITNYQGPAAKPEYLLVGEIPASQVFFSYDLSGLPPLATVNRAWLHLSIADAVVVDTFQVATYAVVKEPENISYVSTSTDIVGTPQSVKSGDSALEIDVSKALQALILYGESGSNYKYLVISSYGKGNLAGYMELYPSDWPDSSLRPYLQLVYTDVPEAAKPKK